jgi:hypothetical protein
VSTAGPIGNGHRHADIPFLRQLLQQPRGFVEGAAGRRAYDDFHVPAAVPSRSVAMIAQ